MELPRKHEPPASAHNCQCLRFQHPHRPRGHAAAGIVAFTVSSALPDFGQPQALHQPTCGAGSGSRSGHDRHCASRASTVYAASGPSRARLASALLRWGSHFRAPPRS